MVVCKCEGKPFHLEDRPYVNEKIVCACGLEWTVYANSKLSGLVIDKPNTIVKNITLL